MNGYDVSHLGDRELLRDLAACVARDRTLTAALLAHLAEVDARRLYLPAAYPSMFLYCVHELRLSEDAAFKRLRAARTARQFPAVFDAVADGRLHVSAVVLLTPYLTEDTAEELLAAAAHRTKSEIEHWLAQRFPRTELLPMMDVVPATPARPAQLAPEPVGTLASRPVGTVAPRHPVPVAAQRFQLQLTIGQRTHDTLRYAQELLRHQIPSGDVAEVIGLALDALVARLEKRKFAATRTPRLGTRRTSSQRHIPAPVKRAVWQRDGGRCTFVSDAGKHCNARDFIEFDHADPVARGGQATVDRMRLRCRAHNQYEAECMFGTAFMDTKRHPLLDNKRQMARKAAACAQGQAQACVQAQAQAGVQMQAQARARDRSGMWLRDCDNWDSAPTRCDAPRRTAKPFPTLRSKSACASPCLSCARGPLHAVESPTTCRRWVTSECRLDA